MLKAVIDWDDQQIRLIVGQREGRRVRLRLALITPIGENGLQATLSELIREHSLEKLECLVAVGRDRAELRQMEFPPVPVDELPDIVRFQAIRQFASAGDSATVDFMTTRHDETGVKAIVSAAGPADLSPIRKTVESLGWTLGRIALRPIAAAALYRILGRDFLGRGEEDSETAVTAVIDLVGDEAEIVLFRGGRITFVRSVRLPVDQSPESMIVRTNALAGEIRRSLMACGAATSKCDVVMWGTASRHEAELQRLGQKLGARQDVPCQTRLIDPLELIDVDQSVRQSVGATVGRLAPLVGLLVADEQYADQLIDFVNPRKTVEATTDRRKVAAIVGIPTLAIVALIWMLWGNLARLDEQIEMQQTANGELREKSEAAAEMIARTDRIDLFLDGDVLWLDELRRLAEVMPPADQLILKEVTGVADGRSGGGRLVISGMVTSPVVIDEFEAAVRDQKHQVIGDKVTQLASSDAYQWQMNETISVSPETIRNERYARMNLSEQAAVTPEEAQ